MKVCEGQFSGLIVSKKLYEGGGDFLVRTELSERTFEDVCAFFVGRTFHGEVSVRGWNFS